MRNSHIFKRLVDFPRRFVHDRRASLSVEAVIVLPALLWCFVATFTYFEAFRTKNLAIKGNYAISDLLSRETNEVDENYFIGMGRVYRYLTRSDSSSWIRATLVQCIDKCDEPERKLEVKWSAPTNGHAKLTDEDIRTLYDGIIPKMALGETVAVMETTMIYTPIFSSKITGVGQKRFNDIVTTRPRFIDNIPCDAASLCP